MLPKDEFAQIARTIQSGDLKEYLRAQDLFELLDPADQDEVRCYLEMLAMAYAPLGD
jgi:hypothetical protein